MSDSRVDALLADERVVEIDMTSWNDIRKATDATIVDDGRTILALINGRITQIKARPQQ